jgi:hypothetical protein
MLVTITNNSGADRFVSSLYVQVPNGGSVTTRRSFADLSQDLGLRQLVQSGSFAMSFALEAGDSGPGGWPTPPASYTNITRPNANLVPTFSLIWNTDDNAYNYSDGTLWRDALGVPT